MMKFWSIFVSVKNCVVSLPHRKVETSQAVITVKYELFLIIKINENIFKNDYLAVIHA